MCLAIPDRIVEVPSKEQHLAAVEVSGVRRKVNIDLLRDDGLVQDDWVLIHVGFAMSKISAAQAEEQIQLLNSLGEATEAMQEVQGYAFGDEDAAGDSAVSGDSAGARASPFQTDASQADEWPFSDSKDPIMQKSDKIDLRRYGSCTLSDDGCTTCRDVGAPVRVVRRVGDNLALCEDRLGEQAEVATDFAPDAHAGDVLLVHMGVATACIREDCPEQGPPHE